MDDDEVAPYLFHLLGVKEGTERLAVLTAQAIKERTFETLQQMSLRGSRQQPVIFGVEDLHWVDRTSEEYLSFLVERLARAAILILCTYRPGYPPSWIDKSYATQIGIRALSSSDSLVVVPVCARGSERSRRCRAGHPRQGGRQPVLLGRALPRGARSSRPTPRAVGSGNRPGCTDGEDRPAPRRHEAPPSDGRRARTRGAAGTAPGPVAGR
jgi:hypothetical protein